jgi:hypothetical protein
MRIAVSPMPAPGNQLASAIPERKAHEDRGTEDQRNNSKLAHAERWATRYQCTMSAYPISVYWYLFHRHIRPLSISNPATKVGKTGQYRLSAAQSSRTRKQYERFKEAARAVGANDSSDACDRILKKMATPKTDKPKPWLGHGAALPQNAPTQRLRIAFAIPCKLNDKSGEHRHYRIAPVR